MYISHKGRDTPTSIPTLFKHFGGSPVLARNRRGCVQAARAYTEERAPHKVSFQYSRRDEREPTSAATLYALS